MKKHTSGSHYRFRRITPAFPAQWFYGLFRALPGEIGLVCHRHLAPFGRRLDTGVEASGPHDFSVRVSTIRPSRAARAHRIPLPAWVTCATPLSWDRTVRISELIWVRGERKYFLKWGWTAFW